MRLWVAPPGSDWYTPEPSTNLHSRYFQHELDPVPVVVPLVHVNREARPAACFYADKLGYLIFRNKDSRTPILARKMDRFKDVLYFKYKDLENFDIYRAPELLALESTYLEAFGIERHGCCARECKRDYLEGAFEYMTGTLGIYIFLSGKNDELDEINTGTVQKHRVEFDACGGRAWCFDRETRQWAWEPGENIASEELNKEIEAFNIDMTETWNFRFDEKPPKCFIVPVKVKIVDV